MNIHLGLLWMSNIFKCSSIVKYSAHVEQIWSFASATFQVECVHIVKGILQLQNERRK
jgi:hypothetical protein